MGNRYKFNGKEEEEVGGLKLLDYGARRYDAALGRWTGTDPLADSYSPYSPYAYCLNNPVALVDPNGAFSTHYVDEDYNMLFSSNDGSDDVFMVSGEKLDDFQASLVDSDLSDADRDGANWNAYWRNASTFADRQFTEEEIGWLNLFGSREQRERAVQWMLKPTVGNMCKMAWGYTADQYNFEGIITVISSVIATNPVVPKVSRGTVFNPALPEYPPVPAKPGTSFMKTLQPGTVIDRYGGNKGTWASPVGTPYGARSIPPGKSPYAKFKVLKPIEHVEQSIANPGLQEGQYGHGIQYNLGKSIQEYIDNGYLQQIK